jgi:hypothetical protein
MMEGMNSIMIHCKNFYKCHNVLPPSTMKKRRKKVFKKYVCFKKSYGLAWTYRSVKSKYRKKLVVESKHGHVDNCCIP